VIVVILLAFLLRGCYLVVRRRYTPMNTVVLNGFGPHVRFRTKSSGAVQIVTKDSVKTVPLVKRTEVTFTTAA
jgi:hypothetical protein